MKTFLRLPQWALVLVRVGLTAAVAVVPSALAQGCIDRPAVPIPVQPHGISVTPLHIARVDKVDLLLVVDDSSSMADKQSELGKRVPELIRGVTDPGVDSSGKARQPVVDLHVAVISSSLGSHGTYACAPTGGAQRNDHGHLMPRPFASSVATGWRLDRTGVDPIASACPAPVASSALTWTFDAKAGAAASDSTALQTASSCVVESVGEKGCGFEETLESMYHFLIDPAPYASADASCTTIDGVDHCSGDVVPRGVDEELLKERASFLRPDSVLAIVLLTDENDSSLEPAGRNWEAWAAGSHLPRATSGCARVPDDFEPETRDEVQRLFATYGCAPCSTESTDPSCASGWPRRAGTVDLDVDDLGMREVRQVQRFGRNFKWPVQRYIDGLTLPRVLGSDGKLGPNPVFRGVRSTDLVLMAGIVGVPRALVSDPSGRPKHLSAADWDLLVAGDLSKRDPHMIESIAPRAGVPKYAGNPSVDAINGGDREIAEGSDLQYACIAPRATSVPEPGDDTCAGESPELRDPTCATGNLQPRFHAYPGVRPLRVLRGLGDQGVVASICDSSYASAIAEVVDKVQTARDSQCLKSVIETSDDGDVSCLVLQSFDDAKVDGKARCEDVGQGYCTPGATPCRIEGSDYPPISPEVAAAQLYLPISVALPEGGAKSEKTAAFVDGGNVYAQGSDGKKHLVCEMMQLAGGRVPVATTRACEHDPAFAIERGTGGGWCYSKEPDVIGEACRKVGAPGKVRFLGDVDPKGGSEVFTYCVR